MHVLLIVAGTVGVAGLIELAVPRRRGPPRVAVIEQVDAITMDVFGQNTQFNNHGLLCNLMFRPSICHLPPEVLVVVHQFGLREVVEDGQAAEAPQLAVGVVVVGVFIPFIGEGDGKEHLGQVLHLFLVGTHARWHGPGLALVGVVEDVLRGQRVQAHPV